MPNIIDTIPPIIIAKLDGYQYNYDKIKGVLTIPIEAKTKSIAIVNATTNIYIRENINVLLI